jgi:hypothetical protein
MSEAEGGGPHERLVGRLRQLVMAVAEQRWSEFDRRVPAEPDRDADLVLFRAAQELDRLRVENEEMKHTLRQIEDWDTKADTERDAGATYQRPLAVVGRTTSPTKPVLHDDVRCWYTSTGRSTERDAGKPVLHDMPIALWHQIQKHLNPNAELSGAGSGIATEPGRSPASD